MVRKMRDIMSPTPICMAPGESVYAAAKAMKEHGIGTVLVLTDGRLSGLVTDRGITVRVLAENRDPVATPIGDVLDRVDGCCATGGAHGAPRRTGEWPPRRAAESCSAA